MSLHPNDLQPRRSEAQDYTWHDPEPTGAWEAFVHAYNIRLAFWIVGAGAASVAVVTIAVAMLDWAVRP